MNKKIKLREVDTGKIFYADEITDPININILIEQGLINGLSTTDINKMTEEEQKLYSDLGGIIENDNFKTKTL